MSSWNFIVYFSYRFHTFLIRPETSYDELVNIIRSRRIFLVDHDLLEIYDVRFQTYVLLDDEYIRNLQNRLPRTSISTLNGRIRKRRKVKTVQQSNARKYQRQSSVPLEKNDRVHLTTRVDIARSMSVHETSIDDLIQTNGIQHLMTFTDKEECLNYLARIESPKTIRFIISNLSNNEEIVTLVTKHVRRIYTLDTDKLFPIDCSLNEHSRLVIYDEDIGRLVQLIRDLTRRFLDKATSVEQTMVFLKWARKLYYRAMEIDSSSESESDILDSINQQLDKLEMQQR